MTTAQLARDVDTAFVEVARKEASTRASIEAVLEFYPDLKPADYNRIISTLAGKCLDELEDTLALLKRMLYPAPIVVASPCSSFDHASALCTGCPERSSWFEALV